MSDTKQLKSAYVNVLCSFSSVGGWGGVRNRTDPPLGSNSIYLNIKLEL